VQARDAVRVRRRVDTPASVEHVHSWPLGTLAAFLFEGRDGSEVRRMLGAGIARAHGWQARWDPIELSVEELDAVESLFPDSQPDLALDLEAASVMLQVPALVPFLFVPIRRENPVVEAAARRAAYQCFDYGAWADVFLATVSSVDAAAILDDPARRGHDRDEAELARRVVGESDVALRFEVRRAGLAPPWESA